MEKDGKVLFWTRVLGVLSAAFIIFSLASCVIASYFPALVASIVALYMTCSSGSLLLIVIIMQVIAIVIGIPIYGIAIELEKCYKD